MSLEFVRDHRIKPVMMQNVRNGISYLTFPKIEACEAVEHLFTTREGGVSDGQFRSMNFSVNLGDKRENVLKNYKRIASIFGAGPENVVGTVQTHTTNILRVSGKDAGKVACVPPDYGDVDGLITNERGLILAAFVADCVPIFFVDPVNKAIGLAHSGWRGTVANMAGKMVAAMQREFGTEPSDLIVAIGPSICQKCYEVDETVAAAFREAFGESHEERLEIQKAGSYPMEGKNGLRRILEPGKEPGKYQLDLWLANLVWLLRAGVAPSQIDVTDLCTAENPELLFSHRASQGRRGNLGAFLKLK
ncbi:MAG: peptidoglycan editing factor PgeF [Acetatifactor sp.]|nr:peptidoglycan editing factor PgeF [Acetatifactor sp.]